MLGVPWEGRNPPPQKQKKNLADNAKMAKSHILGRDVEILYHKKAMLTGLAQKVATR